MPPKLTPEERKELKAQKKVEKKRKQVEQKKQLSRDLLAREIQYGALTLKKQEKNWRKMLIDIKIPEMMKDLKFAWHNFERVIDCKDFAISLMMDQLDKANQQYILNFKTHSEHIDKLIQMFNDQVHQLHVDYNKQVKQLQAEDEKNTKQLETASKEEEDYLKTILFILQLEMKEVKRTRHAEYFSKLEEQDTKQGQLIQRMKGILEQVHQQMWIDTVQFLNDYKTKISERKKQHNELKNEDDKLQKIIKKQLEQIRKSHNTIRDLKLKKMDLEKFLERKVADLQSEFDFFTWAFESLKIKLNKDRQLDFEKLSHLTVHYNEVINYLNSLEEKGKHILHVSAVCRKLETLEEKILPFPVNFVNEMSRPSLHDVKEYMEDLELFWQRVGKADTLRYAVNEEREFLITENEILKRRIHNYCQCLKCPNYEAFKTKARPCRTVTEGTLELKKYQKQGILNSQLTGEDDQEKNDSLELLSWSGYN